MDPKRTSAQLRACVADLQEYFASAASPARRGHLISGSNPANSLAKLLLQLDRQEAVISEHKDVLFSLTSGLDEVTAAVAALGQPRPGPPPPSRDLQIFIRSWYSLLGAAGVVARCLLEIVNPYSSSEAERERLAASVTACAGAICAGCSMPMHLWRKGQSALDCEASSSNLLEITDDCLRLALDVIGAGLRCVADAGRAGATQAAVAQAAALSAQLRPERVLGWLRCALDAVDWVVSTAGVEQCRCLIPFFGILEHGPCCAALGLGQALCDEPELLSRLARLTARVHAALVAAPNWANAAWTYLHNILCLWAGNWEFLCFTPKNQQAALLPLLVAGGSMLRGEVSLLASLPAQPPAGADAEQAGQLSSCWLEAISMIGRCISLQGSTAAQELSRNQTSARLRSLLLVVAASAPHVLRFVSSAAAGGPAAEGISRLEGPYPLGESLHFWAESCWAICHSCRVLGPAGSAEQQQETASTVAGLVGGLQQLLNRLPRLAETLGEPLHPRYFLKASAEASILLAHRVVPPPGLAPFSDSLVALQTSACRAVHALLSCSANALGLARLAPLPGHGGRLHAHSAAWLTYTLLTVSMASFAALLQSCPTDGDEAAAVEWDSAYTRCLLELTAAESALQPHSLGCKQRRRIKWLRPNSARQRALAVLQQLTTPRFVRQCGRVTAGGNALDHPSQLSEQGVLAALAGQLSSAASRELLPPLLERLLPPAEAGQDSAPTSVPPEAAVLQALALAQRPCAYLLCCSLAGCGEETQAPRGKRCSGCCHVRYCSRACQVADWPAHKAACRALAAAAGVSGNGK